MNMRDYENLLEILNTTEVGETAIFTSQIGRFEIKKLMEKKNGE